MKTLIAALIISTCLFSACKKGLNTNTNVGNTPITKVAPNGFAYHTTKQITVTVAALTNDNKPIAAVSLNIYILNADTLGALIYKGYTDNSGNFSIFFNTNCSIKGRCRLSFHSLVNIHTNTGMFTRFYYI